MPCRPLYVKCDSLCVCRNSWCVLDQGISSVCVCLSLDLTQGVPPLSFHPSNSLGKSKLRSGVGEGGARRRGGEGRYIWKAHLESVVEGEPAGGEGVLGPFAPVSPSLKVRAAGAPGRGIPVRPEVAGWGRPGDSRGGRNAAVGTGPGSRPPSRPRAPTAAGSAGSRAVTLADPHVPGGWTGPRFPAPSGSSPGAVLSLPRAAGGCGPGT